MIDSEIVSSISHHSWTLVVYHFFLGLPDYRFPRLIATKIVYAFLPSKLHASSSEAFGLNTCTINTKWAWSFILRITRYVEVRGLTHRIHGTRSGPSWGTSVGSVNPKFPLLFNPLNPELNPICYLLALLGAHHFLYVSRISVKLLTFRRLMSYIYGAPILDVSRSHTTTQHIR